MSLVWGKLRLIVAALLFLWFALSSRPSGAHPLGNFSVNQYSDLRISRDVIEVRYVIDMAEIPTFQEIQETGIATSPTDAGVKSYLGRKVEALREGLKLEINGQPLSLRLLSQEIIFPPGAGGLPTLKIGALYHARMPERGDSGHYALRYRDDNFTGRAGWKEIIARPEEPVRFLNSSVAQADRSAGLNDYPTDLLSSPPQDLAARVEFFLTAPRVSPAMMASPVVNEQNGITNGANDRPAQKLRKTTIAEDGRDRLLPEEAKRLESSALPNSKEPPVNIPGQLQSDRLSTRRNSFTQIIAAPEPGWGIALIALIVAAGLGAFHALEPGHGKTLVAAYLVGSRGTMKHALLLGLIVTAAHTAGVYLLGGVTLYASRYIVPEQLYPWFGLLSGIMITVLGVYLLMRRYRGRNAAQRHHHHGPQSHEHEHPSDHEHPHSRQPRSPDHHYPHEAASLRELLTLGISGGIVPCPAALVVLLSALSLNRLGFGLLLIVAFSVGLAAVLVAIGVLLVYARRFMSRFQAGGTLTTRWLPVASSAFIVFVGLALTCQALQSTGKWI